MATHEGDFMLLFTRQSGGQGVLPKHNSEDRHAATYILVVLAHIQLKSFYCLSTCDVMSKNVPGPLPLNHTTSDGKLGEGLGTRLMITYRRSGNFRGKNNSSFKFSHI